MADTEPLSSEQLGALDRLRGLKTLEGFYLAGGSAVAYPYPLLEPPVSGPSAFPVAGLTDLATMKLSTIARRGLRRDFWDLYQILESPGASLKEYLDAYLERFGKHESDLYHVIRSLTWFEDAEKEPAFPAGMTPEAWDRIKSFFNQRAPGLLD